MRLIIGIVFSLIWPAAQAATMTLNFSNATTPIYADGSYSFDASGYHFTTAGELFGFSYTAITLGSNAGNLLTFSPIDGSIFDLYSLFHQELYYGPSAPPGTECCVYAVNSMSIFGYRSDGTVIEQHAVQEGNLFGAEWRNLTSVTLISGNGGYINRVSGITVSAVPAPAAAWLFISGLASVAFLRPRKESRAI